MSSIHMTCNLNNPSVTTSQLGEQQPAQWDHGDGYIMITNNCKLLGIKNDRLEWLLHQDNLQIQNDVSPHYAKIFPGTYPVHL